LAEIGFGWWMAFRAEETLQIPFWMKPKGLQADEDVNLNCPRLAVVFKNIGLCKGDIVHTLLSNDHSTISVILANGILGNIALL